MKKQASSKLTLHKETLRKLEDLDLALRVAGGIPTQLTCTTSYCTKYPTCDPFP